MTRFLIAAAGLLALVPLTRAADKAKVVPPAPVAPAASPNGPAGADMQTLIYLGETRPALIRLHVLIDGKPYSVAWDDFMKKLFDYEDANGDGTLNREEAAHVPTVQMMRNHYSGIIGIFNNNPGNIAPFAEMDANKDGKVTLDEFKAYFKKTGFGSFQLHGEPGQGKSGVLTDTLFKYLDKNKDGKLSKEELAAAPDVLHRLDIDEDEMISEAELVPDANPYGPIYFGGPDQGAAASPAFQLFSGVESARIAKALLSRYDKNKDGKLSRAESGFEEATFARLDTNKDGHLSPAELEAWLEGPSDLELTVKLGGLPAKKAPGGLLKAIASSGPPSNAAVGLTPGKDWPLAKATKPRGDGLVLTYGIAEIDVRGDRSNQFFGGGTRNFYVQQFNMALKDKKDYLTKAEAQGNNFLGGLFALADRNSDGKLTLKELNAFFETIDAGNSAFATLTIADHGAGLFELLDANRDGRLGIRELRTGWERLTPWAKATPGMIALAEIPRQYELTVRQGPENSNRRFNVRLQMAAQPRSGRTASGPLWFRKMDRNGDGDVSRREWLGSMEDFKKIDTDGDGLISAEEAMKADAWFRAKLNEKK